VKLPEGILIPDESSSIHGIYETDIENAPYWKTVFYNVHKWVSKVTRSSLSPIVFIAHNCHGFDEILLRKECLSNRRSIPSNWIFFDSLRLFKHMFPERADFKYDRRYNLGALHEDIMGYALSGAHDAMADVTGLFTILQKIGAFSGAVNFNDLFHIGFKKSSYHELSQPITTIRGIGVHTARLIENALYKKNATVYDLLMFVSNRRIEEVEYFVRTISSHEKHVLSLTITLWKLYHEPDLRTEIQLVNQFPFVHDITPFYNLFTPATVRRLQKAGFHGILDLCALDNYHNSDLNRTLQFYGCSDLEIMRFKNNYKKLL
jgi:DNA polymerase III epsilon subunit-like protein